MDRGGSLVTDLEIDACTFDNCGLSLTNNPVQMSRVSGIRVVNSRCVNSVVGPCVVDDVVIDGLKTSDMLLVWGAMFRHVTLTGRIGPVRINRSIHDPHVTDDLQALFAEERARFYASVDWALDISSATLHTLTIEGVPTQLIRRDPSTQIVVNRHRIVGIEQFSALRADFVDLEFALRMFVTRSTEPDLLLAAPMAKSPKIAKHALAGLQLIRDLGLAQPD
jgi:hypothetical protein